MAGYLVQPLLHVALHPHDAGDYSFPEHDLCGRTQYGKAIPEFEKMGYAPRGLGYLGPAYARPGRKAEARAVVPRLKERVDKTGVGRSEIALIYARLQENDEAFEWLERAYQVRDNGLAYLNIDPCGDPLRSDRRFAALIQRVVFPLFNSQIMVGKRCEPQNVTALPLTP